MVCTFRHSVGTLKARLPLVPELWGMPLALSRQAKPAFPKMAIETLALTARDGPFATRLSPRPAGTAAYTLASSHALSGAPLACSHPALLPRAGLLCPLTEKVAASSGASVP